MRLILLSSSLHVSASLLPSSFLPTAFLTLSSSLLRLFSSLHFLLLLERRCHTSSLFLSSFSRNFLSSSSLVFLTSSYFAALASASFSQPLFVLPFLLQLFVAPPPSFYPFLLSSFDTIPP